MTANLLDAKSRALFTAAYGGALDVSVTYSDLQDAHYFEAVVSDIARYGSMITFKNPIAFAVERGAPPIQSESNVFRTLGGAVRQRTYGDGRPGHVIWCGIRTGGAFRRNDAGVWRIEPDQKPLWWDGAEWASKLETLTMAGAARIERYAAGLPFSPHV